VLRAFLADLKIFETYMATDIALKKYLVQAVPSTYLNAMSHHTLGFAQCSTLQLLNHLDSTYGTVTPDDLARNFDRLTAPWSANAPIEELWDQIRIARTIAEGLDTITEPTAIRAATKILEDTGVFTQALLDWRKRPSAEHTMANLLSHFNAADKERLRALTIHQAGYTAGHVPASTDRTPTPDSLVLPGWHYCWSHGLNQTHASMGCSKPRQGHIPTATFLNPQRGSQGIMRPPHEKHNQPNKPRPTGGQP